MCTFIAIFLIFYLFVIRSVAAIILLLFTLLVDVHYNVHQLSCQRLCHQFLYVYFFQGIRFTLMVNGEVYINETLSGKISFFELSLKILNKQVNDK